MARLLRLVLGLWGGEGVGDMKFGGWVGLFLGGFSAFFLGGNRGGKKKNVLAACFLA